MNKDIMKKAGFGEEVKEAEQGNCPFCKKPIMLSDFRNDTSLREFQISALCQSCQDEMFGKDEE